MYCTEVPAVVETLGEGSTGGDGAAVLAGGVGEVVAAGSVGTEQTTLNYSAS